MKQSVQISEILKTFDEHYPKNIVCYLDHETPFQLLIATILSAQCTDDRVNKVTPELFNKYQTVEAFATSSLEELEQDIKSTGFYRNKAKNIIACAKKILSDFDEQVPREIDQLTSLAGVGRKTANVIRGNIYHIPSIVVDTHVKRISIRLGLTLNIDPTQIEMDLMKILPSEHWIRYNTQVIAHGRAICTARSPKCSLCMFLNLCPFGLRKRLEDLPSEAHTALDKGHMY